MHNFFSSMIKITLILISALFLSACGSTGNQAGTGETSLAEKNKQAAQAKEKQRKIKQSILNYTKADDDYKAFVAKFLRGEAQPSDFDAIVRLYPLTSKYSPYGNTEKDQKLAAFESMEQENWGACLQATNIILDENYTSLTGHYGAMVCHYESGERLVGEYHNTLLDGFIDTILRSGDGQTPSSAFYIISTNDLNAFIQLNGMLVTGQSLVYHEERPMDVIEVLDPETKQESTWYFDVTAQFRRGVFDDLESRR
ncbi:MAG: hypothetical protein ACI9IT_000345 [Glaciecola sp.]|jgi:hypothetical protein